MPRRPDNETDEIARAAARLIARGDVSDIDLAIRAAAEALGAADARPPGHGLVRKHAQGMALQALGDDGYREAVHEVWRAIEELMTILESDIPGATCLVAGRAARGQIDAGVTAHVRVYTDASIGAIAEILVGYGYEEPAFETAETRVGRLDRVRFDEGDLGIVVTRCPADLYYRGERDRDLFKGRPIEVATLDDVRKRLA